jgi:hypothetical protein
MTPAMVMSTAATSRLAASPAGVSVVFRAKGLAVGRAFDGG